jgi:CheY-like chemotaxis protein
MQQHVDARPHVLLVEDEPLVNMMMSEALADSGFDVCAVTSAADAVNHLAAGEPFDVMFTDVHMSGMSGAELARVAHRMRPDLRIVYTSGGALAANERLPESTFVPKPYEPWKVCALLSRVVKRA